METGPDEAYKPRFMNEIFDELNVLENKKDPLFCKCITYLKLLHKRKVKKNF